MIEVKLTRKNCTTDPLFQWDTNQILRIFGLSLPVVPEVHFSHDTAEQAIVQRATMNAAGVVDVLIPNTLLQHDSDVIAYVCTEQGGTFQSLYKITIPVIGRAQPGDGTEEE